jgi:ubiquinone/menaquinone biosynthesis C-methylase UbiE
VSLGRIDWAKWYRASQASIRSLERAYPPARLLDALSESLPRGRGSFVLELGCAPGRWLAWCESRLGVKPLGVELDKTGLALSHSIYRSVPLVNADARELPFQGGSIDAVYALGLLEHFEDPTPILVEAKRVLRGGGISIWSVPNLEAGSICRWHWEKFRYEEFIAHRVYTLAEFTGLITNAGYTVRSSQYNGIYIPKLQRVMGRLPLRPLFRRLENSWNAASLVVVATPDK